ncbi:2-hydroxy-3-oxopropionate reductase [Roseobacter fucihabitans]|uniref:2-hydroxy-3-oxopropionate reductase n=1 Tax=Roseobacter fucihabitans TaxID=1537242 RepID=A0ABZ2BSU0_9RHOB|nr:NAD(P)-dependent oxidoreductase [Roseobacter litoralis]MBC6967030.1 2-hydroxy-3-oxopropionate reductase [Roseobacter litoralis]
MRIGFAGLGRMGVPMAHNLARAGFALSVWNRTQNKAQALVEQTGCSLAATPRALAEASDVIVTMLADDLSSQAVHFGTDGIFAADGMRTVIEMGTMSPDHIKALAQSAPPEVTIIDAPVSGATQAAAGAQLLVMAGCTQESAMPHMPIFDAMSKQTICLGSLGAGAVMKLSINALIHGLNQTVSEALTLVEAAGISTKTAFDVIESSAAAAPMLKYRRPLYLDEAAHEVTFTVALARKDMQVTADLADQLGVALPQGRETLALLRSAEASGYGSRDMASMLNYMRKYMRKGAT